VTYQFKNTLVSNKGILKNKSKFFISTGVQKSRKSKFIILDTSPVKNKYKNESNHKNENNESISDESISDENVSDESVSNDSEECDEVPAELRSSERDPKPFTGRYSALSIS
jgi:hypothetical protein